MQGDSNALDIIGWVTMENRSGKEFENARVKLMAGDVNKIQPQPNGSGSEASSQEASVGGMPGRPSGDGEDLRRVPPLHAATPGDHPRQGNQAGGVRPGGGREVRSRLHLRRREDRHHRYQGWNPDMIRNDSGYGTQSNPKVWVMREFVNSDANHLGMPLPKGSVRFYRRDTDGQLEFTGEDTIDHTPKDEKIRVFTGAAFDLTGERKRTIFHNDMGRRIIDEAFEIKVRNHKKEPAEVRVVEHLYRGMTWDNLHQLHALHQDRLADHRVPRPAEPGEEKTVTYAAHYTW